MMKKGSRSLDTAALTSSVVKRGVEGVMEPLLSESGTPEIGFGIFACVIGALHFVFDAVDEPGAFQSGALLAMGFGIACYGAILRRVWNKQIRDQPEERRKQQLDKPKE